MNVLKIITEEIISFINESFENEKDVYDLYEVMDDVKYNLINDFLYNNNSTFTKKINWTVVPFEKLRRVWNDYMRFGKVQNTKLLDDIERKIIRNAFLLNALTEIYGHTMSIPEEFNELIENYVTNQINCFENEKTKNQYKINWENPSKPQINNQNCFGGLNPTIKSLIEEHDDLSMNEIKLMLVKYLKDKFYDNYGIDKKVEEIYSTGLQVTKDPGVWVVWLGCLIMVGGLIVTFFISHRRVWVLLSPNGKETNITIVGSTNRNLIAFERDFQKLTEGIRAGLGKKQKPVHKTGG